ncbi:hypothetical protein M1446_05015 [Candidatus Dependentiae bacterium]|nr:hypothetical protein [Candidatus Dependentiae bacterium]
MNKFALALSLFATSYLAAECEAGTTVEKTMSFNFMSMEDCRRMRTEFCDVLNLCSEEEVNSDDKTKLRSFMDSLIEIWEPAIEKTKALEMEYKDSLERFNKVMRDKDQAQADAMVNELMKNEAAMMNETKDCCASDCAVPADDCNTCCECNCQQ